MRPIALVLPLLFFAGESADAAWLLWKHSFVTRRVEGAPRGLNPEGNVDKWELLNALDLRKECLGALRSELKKTYDGLASTYPGEPVSQSVLADGVSATVAAGAEKREGGGAKTAQLYYQFTLWCLPVGVDPRSTRPPAPR